MEEHDLHISTRLKKLLPPLTAEEKKQLEANLVADGRVLDPILWWYDGEKKWVADGMHRYPIAVKLGIPFTTERLEGPENLEDLEIWILDHQLGRRNLMKPAAIRKTRGQLYNRLKRKDGGHGDHTPQSERPEGQNVPPLTNSAEKIGEKAGVSARTVKRDGARVEALEACTPSIQKVIDAGNVKATDAEIKTLSNLPVADQNTVATSLRKGRAKSVKEALKLDGIKPLANGKPDLGKCPSCAGAKWNKSPDGFICAKCNHPHGEPAGDTNDKALTTQRQKTVKTAEALMRAFDDLQTIKANRKHKGAIETCKGLLVLAKEWK